MNSNTDKKNTPLKGVYTFYSVIIALCILALIVFHLNIYAKAVLCTVIVLCVCIMRSASKAFLLPPDIDPDTMQSIVPVSGSGSATEVADADAETESLCPTWLLLSINNLYGLVYVKCMRFPCTHISQALQKWFNPLWRLVRL